MRVKAVPINISGRKIGDGYPCFVTYEAGPTHSGIVSAKRLVKLAADAGADAVKFQIFDPDRLVADRKQLFTYDVLTDRENGTVETVNEPLYDILARRCLSEPDWRELKHYADEHHLAFFATVGFDEDIDLLVDIGCDSIKIASADINHLPLIKRAARTGMCIQLDTGNATLGEIEEAVDIIRAEGNERIIIHQCPSGYPAHFESINLNVIKTLRHMFPYPVAFSDHTPGWDMDIAAVAMGANMVEKTITEDRTTRSVEHLMSLEPNEMKSFVRVIRELETAFGSERRIMQPQEIEKRNAVRRSLHLRTAVKAGTPLRDVDFEFRRPGYGIAPDEFEQYLSCKIKHDLSAGHRIQLSDLL